MEFRGIHHKRKLSTRSKNKRVKRQLGPFTAQIDDLAKVRRR